MDKIDWDEAKGTKSVYGVYMDITSEICDLAKIEADHKAEIHISVDGEVKEMTLAEFKQKLGFVK